MAPDDVAILMARMLAMEATWREHEKAAIDRTSLIRKSQDLVMVKLEKMDDKLNTLPCDERYGACKGLFNNLHSQVKLIWGFLTLMIATIIADWWKK